MSSRHSVFARRRRQREMVRTAAKRWIITVNPLFSLHISHSLSRDHGVSIRKPGNAASVSMVGMSDHVDEC
jgi:hypothetical protein